MLCIYEEPIPRNLGTRKEEVGYGANSSSKMKN
jgi:hypothetical protein